jgi:hypothetical protein
MNILPFYAKKHTVFSKKSDRIGKKTYFLQKDLKKSERYSMMKKANTKFATRKALVMKKTTLMKKWLTDTCIWFTVITLILMLLPVIFNRGIDGIPHTKRFLFVFPFALSFSAAQLLLTAKPLSSTAKRALHYLITLLAFYLFLWLPAKGASGFTSTLIALFLLSILYWLIFLTVFLTKKRFRGFTEED